jgi:PAS domain S-box-containing protein
MSRFKLNQKNTTKVVLNPILGLMWGTVATLVLLGVLAYGTYVNFLRLSEANKWHIHTYEVLSQVSTVRGSLDKFERYLRGYALSGDPIYISTIAHENEARRSAMQRILALTGDQEEQQNRLKDLNRKYDAWYKKFVVKYIDPRRNIPPVEAAREITPRRLEIIGLQKLLGEVEQYERLLLNSRTKEQAEAQHSTSTMLLLGITFTIGFAVVLLLMLGRTARDHETAARDLETINAKLNEEVIERRIATDKAHASEEMYRHLAEDSIDLICRHKPDGTLTYVSPASMSLVGYKNSEMLGLTPMHFLFPTEKSYLLHRWNKFPEKQFARIMGGTTERPLLRRYLHKDGHEVWLETIGHTILDSETGEVREWHTTSRDVSARVRAEENRKRMAIGLRSIVEVTDELLLCPDEITLVSRAVELGQRKLGVLRCDIVLNLPDGNLSDESHRSSVSTCEVQTDGQPTDESHITLREKWDATTPIVASSGELGVFCYNGAESTGRINDNELDLVTEEIIAVYCSILGTLLERERTQSRWRESQHLLQTIVANAPMLLYAVNKEGYFTVASGRAFNSIASKATNYVGKHIDKVQGVDSDSAKIIRRVLAGESMHETLHIGERYIELWREPIYAANGQIEGALGVGFDNTERVLAEMELRNSLEMQRAILEGASYSIIATDAKGIIRVFNGAAERMLGYSVAEMIGHDVRDFFYHIYDMDEVEARARDLSYELNKTVTPDIEVMVAKARVGLRDEHEWTNKRKDGQAFPVRMAVQAMHDSEGQIMGYVSIGYDLTESRRAERLKNEFVSVVSHELRTPLTSIRGSLGLMQGGITGTLPDAARQMIDIAAKNADRLVLLINDILDIEKIESDQMRFEFGEISVDSLLRNAVEANLSYGETFGVDIRIDEIGKSDEKLSIYGDEARLMQVLTNFLSNACKFSPEGGTVWIGAKRISHGRARIWVSDEGEGVSPEFENRLFRRFMQADSSATRKKGGTGLGLAIAKAIVERHGGRIGYLKPHSPQSPSAQRRGATFYFDVDLIELNSNTPKTLPKVLVTEDDEDVAGLLKSLLRYSGYDVEIAHTLSDARQRLTSGDTFAAMTLDLELPDGNGIDLLREIRESSESKMLRELPVLVISAHCESGKLCGGAFGVIDWLEKPFAPEKILESIALTNHTGKAKILHVEDDADVRRVTELILSDSAQITPAASLFEARKALESEQFHLALIDVGLPDGSGLELISLLSALDPPVPVVLFSAREDEISHLETVAASLTKSRTTNAKLRETIGKLIGHDSD